MWENRLSGSEGGVALTRHPYPYHCERSADFRAQEGWLATGP